MNRHFRRRRHSGFSAWLANGITTRRHLQPVFLLACLVLLGGHVQLARAADLVANPRLIPLRYKEDCQFPTQIVTLGTQSARLDMMNGDADHAGMFGNFAVTPGLPPDLWYWAELHYVQVITSDTCPAAYNGVSRPRAGHSMVDPPRGGWDYMYNNPGTRTFPKAEYNRFINNDCWYDDNRDSVICRSYSIGDAPGYCSPPMEGAACFTTYLVAEAKRPPPCPGDTLCLNPGQILLLDAWDWCIERHGATITNTLSAIRIPGPNDLPIVTDGLEEGGFPSGCTPFLNLVVCCPTPGSLTVLILSGGLLSARRRRAA